MLLRRTILVLCISCFAAVAVAEEVWIQFIGHDYAVRINDAVVTTWSDVEERSASGYIGLQNYNDGKTVRFRNLRIKELPPGARP